MGEMEASGLLPKEIRDLAAAIGYFEALALVGVFGGCRVDVPASLADASPNSLLVAWFGPELVARLVAHYGGQVLTVPEMVPVGRRRRDAATTQKLHADIVRARQQGKLVREIALEYGVSMRWVWGVLAAHKKAQG